MLWNIYVNIIHTRHVVVDDYSAGDNLSAWLNEMLDFHRMEYGEELPVEEVKAQIDRNHLPKRRIVTQMWLRGIGSPEGPSYCGLLPNYSC